MNTHSQSETPILESSTEMKASETEGGMKAWQLPSGLLTAEYFTQLREEALVKNTKVVSGEFGNSCMQIIPGPNTRTLRTL